MVTNNGNIARAESTANSSSSSNNGSYFRRLGESGYTATHGGGYHVGTAPDKAAANKAIADKIISDKAAADKVASDRLRQTLEAAKIREQQPQFGTKIDEPVFAPQIRSTVPKGQSIGLVTPRKAGQRNILVEAKRKEAILKTGLSLNPLAATIFGAQSLEKEGRIIIESPDKGVPLYPEIKQDSPEAAGFFGVAALGLVQRPFSIAKEIDIGRISELTSRKTQFLGVEKQAGDETILKLSGGRETLFARQKFSGEISGSALAKGKTGQRFAGEGTLTSETEVELFLKTLQSKGVPQVSRSTESIKLFGKGEVGKTLLKDTGSITSLPSNIRTTLGEITTVRRSIKADITLKSNIGKLNLEVSAPVTKTSGFTGLSFKEADTGLTALQSGRIERVRIFSNGRATGISPQTQQGIIKTIEKTSSDSTSGAGKLITSQIPKTNTGLGLQSLGQSAIKKSVTPLTPKSTNINLPSLTSLKQSQVQEVSSVSQTPKVIQEQSPQALELKSIENQRFIPQIKTSISSRSSGRTKTTTINLPKLNLAQTPINKQGTRVTQIPGQITRQKQQQQKSSVFTPIITPIIPRVPKTPTAAKLILPRFPSTQSQRQSRKPLTAQVRRGGVFSTVSIGDIGKVTSEGFGRVAGTLAASVKFTGLGATKIQTPKGFIRKSTKGGTIFIEKRSKRLSKKTETKEIQRAKAKKKPKKKTKKVKKKGGVKK